MGLGPGRPKPRSEPPPGPINVRAADKHDLDAITGIVKDGFPDDSGCDYKYPYRNKYPEDFWEWTRREYKEYLDQPAKFAVLVATQPVAADPKSAADQSRRLQLDRPIAYAVWDIAVHKEPKGGDHGINIRRDANPKHMRVYADTMSAAFAKYFDTYGNEQLSLDWLITHPDFRRRGAGTMLCQWGENEAIKRGGWTLTVMASPLGTLLYEHLGYRNLATVTAQADGERDKVDITVLAKEDVGVTAHLS